MAQPRAVIYCRVSTERQEEDGTSLDTQEERCRAYCEHHGYELAGVFADTFTGARYRERPGLTALREQVRAGCVDVVVAYALDRLSRNQAHLAILAEEASDHGARLEFVTETFDDSPTGQFIRAAKAFAAELEREKIIERTERGRQAILAQGLPVGSATPPFGMRWGDERKTHFVPDPVTAPIVRRIFASIVAGASIRAVGRALEADGFPAPRGGRRWDPSTLRHILRSRVYVGEGHWYKTRAVKLPNGKTTHRARPAADHVPLRPGTYPALIDHATFEQVQRLLESRRQDVVAFRTRRNPEVGLLRGGLARCGVCGSYLAVGRNRADIVYRCPHDRKAAGVCTGGGVIPVDVLDAAAWTYVAGVLTDPARIHAHLEAMRHDDPTAADLDALARHQADLERQRASLTTAIAKLADNPHALDELVGRLDAVGKRLAVIEREREEVLARQAAWQANVAALEDLEARCREVEAALALATGYADRRALLHILRVRADLYPRGAPERWVITSGVVADVATNLMNTDSVPQQITALPVPLRWSSTDAERRRRGSIAPSAAA